MKNRISAIIFDKNYSKHNFNNIESIPFYYGSEELHFDIVGYDNSKDILSKLYDNIGFDCMLSIGNIDDFPELFSLPYQFRKKWVHNEFYNESEIADNIISTFLYNINRENVPTFSIFTCAYKTPKEFCERLYRSLLSQTYKEWNWWILDDSPEGEESYFSKIKDPRITIIKNVTNHGNIGFNKHMIAMCCDGDYLVEVDHDDELRNDCLEYLKKAFDTYPDCDFAYSYGLEIMDGKAIHYDDGYALGLGRNETHIIDGNPVFFSTTPDINVLSMRHIVSMPNHVRCWKKDFYHKIGGHNTELSILDDMDLLIRTYLNGKMCKIPKVLYIQNEGTTEKSARGSTTQASRYAEIIRTGRLLKEKYDKEIHDKALKDGIEDEYWVEEIQLSDIFKETKNSPQNVNYILDI